MSIGTQIKEDNLREPIQQAHGLVELAQYLIKMMNHLICPKDNQSRLSIILTLKPFIFFIFYFHFLGSNRIRIYKNKKISKIFQWLSIIHKIKYKDIYPYVIQPQAAFHHRLSPLYLTIMHFRLAAFLLVPSGQWWLSAWNALPLVIFIQISVQILLLQEKLHDHCI